jgi:hypothetical protein
MQQLRNLYSLPAWCGPNGLRNFILQRDVVCRVCKQTPSTVVDHIKDPNGDTILFFDRDNAQGVCKPCSDTKETGRWDHCVGKPTSVEVIGSRTEHLKYITFITRVNGILQDQVCVPLADLKPPISDELFKMKEPQVKILDDGALSFTDRAVCGAIACATLIEWRD